MINPKTGADNSTLSVYRCIRTYHYLYTATGSIGYVPGSKPPPSIIHPKAMVKVGAERMTYDDEMRDFYGTHPYWEWISGRKDKHTILKTRRERG